MTDPIRALAAPHDKYRGIGDEPPRREWLVTNGLGGYAAGTVGGLLTRRYHGLLIAALPAPLGRFMMLNHLLERVRTPDRHVRWLGDEEEVAGPNAADRAGHLVEFRLELGLPVWEYELGGVVLQKRMLMPHEQNTVHVTYRMLEGDTPVRLALRPSVHFRPHEAAVNESPASRYIVSSAHGGYELSAGPELPVLRLAIRGLRGALTLEAKGTFGVPYQVEANRGYEASGPLWSPGYFRADVAPGQDVTLIASTEHWDTIEALTPASAAAAEQDRRRRLLAIAGAAAHDPLAAELVLAADQFVVTPAGRAEEAASARAAGEEARTVIAGYHWFTDWGRDTMISLEGLALCTGRHREAGAILRTFARHVRDGLIPNMFPDHTGEGLYHTADATLWFFHAVERYVRATGDSGMLRRLLPTFNDILRRHLEGTRFGIGVDTGDGLLRQGEAGYQLTWMDAKVDDWVVTPRRGKAVEINALWYNALRLMEEWCRELHVTPFMDVAAHAARARRAFNERFWYADGGYLYDVVDGDDGDDPACRPNQVFAIALDYPVLDEGRWAAVFNTVRERLLTPVGLRSLAPGHPDYKAQYYGDLRARDAAYHQGTVWGWLIGPYVDAWLKVRPGDGSEVETVLRGFESHMNEACVGTISEIFDAEPPFTPRGCVAQAWSIAEVLRSLEKVRAGRPATGVARNAAGIS